MKAVVIKVCGKHAVQLTQNGDFVKVENRGYHVGQVLTDWQGHRRVQRALLLAASLLFCLMSAVALAADRLPFYYVSVDVNPSVELACNWFDRVLYVNAANDDAVEMVDRLAKRGVVNSPLKDALGMLLEEMDSTHSFTAEDQNDVIIAVASYGLKQVDGMPARLGSEIHMMYPTKSWNIHAMVADAAMVDQARQYHTTVSKLMVVQTLMASPQGQQATLEEWLQKPVREIYAGVNNALPDAPAQQDPMPPPAPQAPSNLMPQTVDIVPAEEFKQMDPGKDSSINPKSSTAPKSTTAPNSSATPPRTAVPQTTVIPQNPAIPQNTALPKPATTTVAEPQPTGVGAEAPPLLQTSESKGMGESGAVAPDIGMEPDMPADGVNLEAFFANESTALYLQADAARTTSEVDASIVLNAQTPVKDAPSADEEAAHDDEGHENKDLNVDHIIMDMSLTSTTSPVPATDQ